MSKYITLFDTHTDYETYINGSDKVLPNVSYCENENDVHYNPYIETRIITKFNVEDDSEATNIMNNGATSQFSEIEINGVVQPSVVSSYTFDTTGEHTIKYTLTDPTQITNGAFFQCSSLTSVIIPNSVTTISNAAFRDCSSLTSLTIGNGITTLDNSAFQYCSSLTNITVQATTPPVMTYAAFDANVSGRKIYVPAESVEAYKAARGWSDYASDIEAIL